MMSPYRIPTELWKTFILLCIFCACSYGLGIHSNAGSSNNLYEIIVEEHLLQNENELRYDTQPLFLPNELLYYKL